jgi:hypothetical protein
MDEAWTETSFSSPDLPPSTITWSNDGTAMTVHPTLGLQYRLETETQPREYHFSVTTAARDAAGNRLVGPSTFSFQTGYLHAGLAPLSDVEFVGEAITASGRCAAGQAASLEIGDLGDNRGVGLVVTFDLTTLAPRVSDGAWISAQLSLGSTGSVTGLGSLMAYQMSSAPDQVSWSTPALSAIVPSPDGLSFDVRAAMLDDIAHITERHGLTQYLIRFAQSTNGDGVPDLVYPTCSGILLNVTYESSSP